MIRSSNTVISTVILGGAGLFGSSDIMAQTIGLEYVTEWQTDFDDGYDWLNLLKVTATQPINKYIGFDVATISTAKTSDRQLIEDLLTYSNIEAGNIPLTFSRLGFDIRYRDAAWFIGVNNVNEDYFTSETTSFFTNSSCGIAPTLSCNYDIANYPVASMCLHYYQKLGDFGFQTSVYPGRGYSRIFGHDNLFSLDIKRDGIFSITSIDYKRNGFYCVLGTAFYHGVCMGDEERQQSEISSSPAQKSFSASPWLTSEIDFSSKLSAHLHASISTVKYGCKSYAGLGLVYNGEHIQPGLALNYAGFSDENEFSAEITCRIPILSDKAYMQPAIHLVKTENSPMHCVGMLRLNFCI